jgi:hypothetical protein
MYIAAYWVFYWNISGQRTALGNKGILGIFYLENVGTGNVLNILSDMVYFREKFLLVISEIGKR